MHRSRLAGVLLISSIAFAGFQSRAQAGPSLVVDVASGRVLEQENATRPWYPASLTKLLTLYIALSAVRDGKVSMDTPFEYSALAASMPPSKMGFKPGVEVTLGNAIKMMMVHSANDLAIMIAEGLDGSVANFAADMNRTAAKLGLQESHFDNPNGLPDPNHWSSARDLALVARALFRDFPQYAGLYDIGAVQLGKTFIPTHNNIMGRYPGIDGMKTGYTCAAGFNVVASVTRGGRHLIVVVLGSPNVKARTMKAGELMDAAFENRLQPGPTLEALPKSTQTQPPDMHSVVCGPHRPKIAVDEMPNLPAANSAAPGGLPPKADQMYAARPARYEAVPVFVGPKPGWTGPVAAATDSPPPLPLAEYESLNTEGEPQPAAPVRRHRVARHAHGRRTARHGKKAHGKPHREASQPAGGQQASDRHPHGQAEKGD